MYCTCGCENMYIVQSIHIWKRVQDEKKQERQKCPAGTRQTDGKNWGLVWRNRKKISQIIKDYFHLPFFLLIILCMKRFHWTQRGSLSLRRSYRKEGGEGKQSVSINAVKYFLLWRKYIIPATNIILFSVLQPAAPGTACQPQWSTGCCTVWAGDCTPVQLLSRYSSRKKTVPLYIHMVLIQVQYSTVRAGILYCSSWWLKL
jgi:hypothetical protein